MNRSKHALGLATAAPGLLLCASLSSAQESWTARYDGPPNGPGAGTEVGTDVAVDAAGNVYVTGISDATASGPSGTDFATIKYDAAGNELWVARYDGPGQSGDDAYAIAVDDAGHVYVCGSSVGNGTNRDFATVKYDAQGNELWAARYDGPGNQEDAAYAIAVDGAGHVYVTGWSDGTGAGSTGLDYATLKYDAAGQLLWERRYDGPGSGQDRALALALDPAGGVCVTGSSLGAGSDDDYATLRYDAAGQLLWAARYDGPGNARDTAHALAVGADGGVHVTGYSDGTGAGPSGWDCATVKYDAAGNELWAARYDGTGADWDEGWAVALDEAGNVHVAGGTVGAGAGWWDFLTLKYDAAGNELWNAHYDGSGGGFDEAFAIALGQDGSVFVTGGSEGENGDDDYATLRYAADGNELWVARYDGPGQDYDDAYAIALSPEGDVVVTGASWGGDESADDILSARLPALGLYADRDSISLMVGGQQGFTLAAGPAHGLELYLVLGSMLGSQPGLFLDGHVLPLNVDAYFLNLLIDPNSATHPNTLGVLDANGGAQAALVLPAGLSPTLAGSTLHHAFLLIDPNATPGQKLVSFASNAVPLELLP